MTARGAKLWRWLAGSAAALAIIAGLAVGAFRLALESLPEYESQVAARIREATGLQLSFDSLDARIGRYGPEIFFEGARIAATDGADVLVTADAGRASLSLLRSAWFRRLEIGRVVLEHPRLNLVIFPDRHVELVGQQELTRPRPAPGGRRGLDRIPRGVIEIRGATIAFVDLRAERGSWQLTNVDLELDRSGDSVRLSGTVDLPAQLGESIRFEARVEGELDDLRAVAWRGKLEAQEVDLAGWADLLPETFPVPAAGRGTFRVSASGFGAEFRRGRAMLRLADLALPATQTGAAAVVYRRLGANVTIVREATGWHVTGTGIELSLPGADWTPTDLEATLALHDGRFESGRLHAGYLRLENLVPLAVLLPESTARQRVEQLTPRGTLRRIDLEVSGVAPRQVPELRGFLEFEDLGVDPVGRVPGVTGLDGRLRADGPDGVASLSARNVTMNWPAQWREPAPFPRIDARLGWSRALDGVRIWADDVVASDGRATATGRLRLLARPGQSVLMDIAANLTATDISHTSRYMPTTRVKPKPLAWLDAAFLGGRITHGRVEITGPGRGFPYRDGQGRFVATVDLEDAAIHFAPGWSPLAGLRAHAEFAGPSLRVTDVTGQIEGVRVMAADAEIPDWRQGFLTVRATGSGDAADVHRLLAGSPLGPGLGRTFTALSAAGPVDGDVVMYLPLKQFDQRSITIRGRALGIRLSLAGIDAPVEGLTGEAWFRGREITAPALRGRFMGGEAEASVSTVARADGRLLTTVRGGGVLDAALLPRIVRLPLDSGLAGETPWNGSYEIDHPPKPGDAVRARVRIESSLAGVRSALPEPLAKRADETRPLLLDLQVEPASILARVRLGRELRALLDLRRGEGGLRLSSGTVRLGGSEVDNVPVGPGLRIEGRLPYLSVTGLTGLRWEGPPRAPLESLLSGVALEVGRLEVLGYEFERVAGRMRPGNGAWDVEVSAPAARGQLRVPFRFAGGVPLVLDLDRLYVGERRAREQGEVDPRSLPDMRVDVRDLVFDGRRLGHLSAEVSRSADGLLLDALTARAPAYEIEVSGTWRVAGDVQHSTLEFGIDMRDVLGFLEAFRLGSLIEGRQGRVQADLNWIGGPDSRVLERVSGTVRVRLGEGRILNVEPGAGRILGLMSIAHLPRRLALDFDDLTEQGLAFDSIRGDFTLATGEAYTDNLTLRGAAAEIGIAGRTSLRERTYDQTAVVTGDLGASLGVAGAIAGGPAVGAALLLFSQIFKEPLKGVARGYYRISGPWDDPLVRKIDARELEEAAGLGLPPSPPPSPGAPPAGAS